MGGLFVVRRSWMVEGTYTGGRDGGALLHTVAHKSSLIILP